MAYMEYVNKGPWKVRRAGACGDIVDSRDNRLVGSLLWADACDIVKMLNQRWRWLREFAENDARTFERHGRTED